jgi:hypothetical protein
MTQRTESIAMHKKDSTNFPFYLGCLFFSFYLLGELFPNYWWATHSSHFVSGSIKYGSLGGGLFLIVLSRFENASAFLSRQFNFLNNLKSPFWLWLLALGMAFLFYYFPMVEDFYGEAYKLNKHLLKTASSIPEGTHEHFFSFGLAPWDGQNTIFALLTYLVYFSGVTYREGFILMDAFFGFCFVLSWLYFLRRHIHQPIWALLLVLAGLSAPFLLNFYGHIEINAPVLWINLLWISLAVRYAAAPSNRLLWVLFALLFVCMKFHPVGLLFVPVWLVLLIARLRSPKAPLSLSWKAVASYCILPVYLIGAICYFFVFEDYKDPRNLDYNVQEYDRLFLPLLSPEAPLDRYNLFSFNHLFDYFSEFLLWSPIAFFLLVLVIVLYRKKVNWQHGELIVALLSFLFFATLFFVTNPLLSMPMDWDLFSMPAPLILVVVGLLVKQIQDEKIAHKLLPIGFGLALLCFPTFNVHYSRNTLAQKLESLGIRIYHTYYEWASNTIHYGLGLIWEDRALQLERKNQILQELQAYAVEGNDREYARLWRKEGIHFFHVEKNYPKAYTYLENSLLYFPNDPTVKSTLMQAAMFLNQPERAYELSMNLLQEQYPSKQQSFVFAIQCALEVEQYPVALQLSTDYLKEWPKDQLILEINQRLLEGKDLEVLKELF